MPSEKGPKNSEQEMGKAWEIKLKPGAVQLLEGVSKGFQDVWEHYRQVIPQNEIEKANLPDLDWSTHYRDMHADASFLDILLEPDTFVSVVEESFKKLAPDRNELLLSALAFQYAMLFVLNGLEHPSELLKRIRDGDDNALFDFAKVDKTIIVHRYVEKRIRLAQVSGDSEFFQKLGNALKWDPRNRRFKIQKRNFLLKIIALYATEHLTMNEICDILEQVCGIDVEDVETVRKAWNRAGLNKVLPKEKSEKKEQ